MSNAAEVMEMNPLDDLDAPEALPLDTGFRVDGPGSADWALRKLGAAEAKQAEVEAIALREIEHIESWRKAEAAKIDRDVQFFRVHLSDYHRRELEVDDRKITISLPHGVLKSRQLPAHWEFDDETFIAWADEAERPELVRVKREVNKTEAKKVLAVSEGGDGPVVTASGETVPGVHVTAGERSFDAVAEVAK